MIEHFAFLRQQLAINKISIFGENEQESLMNFVIKALIK